jgi:hypothetical protein
MALNHLPRKLAKIRSKNHERFQFVGISNRVETCAIARVASDSAQNYRIDA